MDSTQYLIKIATEMAGAKDAASALVDMGERMMDVGASAAQMDSALVSARAQLSSSAAAAKAAASAVAEGQQAYSAHEAGADRAAKAAEKLGQELEVARSRVQLMQQAAAAGGEMGANYEAAAGKVQQLSARHQEAQAKAAALQASLSAEAAALDQLKTAADAAKDAHQQLAAGTDVLEQGVKKAAKAEDDAAKAASGSGKYNEMAEALGQLGGPLGSAGQKAFQFAEGLKKLGGAAGNSAAFAGLVVIVVAIAAAIAVAIVKTAMWAVGLADTARNAALTTAALEKSSDALAGVGKTISQVHDATGVAVDQLQGLAKQLDDAGVSAKDMPNALKAVALAEAALGQGAAAKLVEDLKSGKKSAAELAKEMESKFGGIVAKKMLSLDAQSLRLKENLGKAFGGLKIEGLLVGISKMVGMLDQSTASGRALKWVFESLFQPVIDAAVAAIPSVQLFFLGLAIGALKAYNALKPVIRVIREVTGAGDGAGFDWLETGKVAAYVLAGAFFLLAVAVGLALSPFILIGLAIYQVITVAQDVMAAFEEVGAAISSALDGIDLASIGSAMIDGLVDGITGGASAVVSAMTSLATSAVDAAESALGIASPSKVFAGIGGYTSEGFAEGVDEGAPDARTALERMVDAPSGGAAAGKAAGEGAAAGAAGASGGPITLRVEAGAIVVQTPDGEAAGPAVIKALIDWLERGRGGAQIAAAAT